MLRWLPIFKRELRASLTSPAVCIFLALVMTLLGVLFNRIFHFFTEAQGDPVIHEHFFGGKPLNVNDILIHDLMGVVLTLLVFSVPFLTMRMMADERRSGTHDLLMSYPLRERDIVIGKFLAAWATVSVLIALSAVHVALVWWVSQGRMEIAPVVIAYVGLFLAGGGFVALGLFTSSLTENQLVAGLMSFGLLLLGLMVGSMTPEGTGLVSSLLHGVDIHEHSESFFLGVLRVGDATFFILMMLVFLHLAERVLVIRRQGVLR